MLLPPLTKQQSASKFEEACVYVRVCVYVCEASPRYESHISICQNLLLLMAWKRKKKSLHQLF